MNIDAQDAQDNQDGRLLQETLTRAMIVCGFEDVREHKPAVSGKNPVHPVHRCESKIYSCLTLNRSPATRRRSLFQVSSAPALPGRSSEGETGLFQTSRAPAPQDGADHSRVKPGTLMAFRGQGQVPVPSPSFFVCLRGPSWITLFFCCFRQVRPRPAMRIIRE